MRPQYLNLKINEIKARAEKARRISADCVLCPRKCRVNRQKGQSGECRTEQLAAVSSFHPHFGEEKPLVGKNGSGTIFFANCNLKCIFCQNYEISQLGDGNLTANSEIAGMMLRLQDSGCHNINLVSPTHVIPQVLTALAIAIENGLKVPIVYNSGGYDSVASLKLLESLVDVYMPDFKYGNDSIGEKLSGVKDYNTIAKKALREMHRQVGNLVVNKEGVAEKGLLVRHLVLPENLADSREVFKNIAAISKNTYINIIDQYRPCYMARSVPQTSRGITSEEYKQAVEWAREEGLGRLD